MGFLRNLIGAYTVTGGEEVTGITAFISNIKQPLNIMVVGMLALIALAAIVFAIYLAFKLAKAEDDNKRKEAKNQLLWSIIAVIACVVVFVLINTVFSDAMLGNNARHIEDVTPVGEAVNSVLLNLFNALGSVFDLLTIAAMAFAIYLGVRLATAEDENKRKQAKAQLLWTLIGIIASIVLITVINSIVFDVLIKQIP